jgi:uncharacterized OB-fold protein
MTAPMRFDLPTIDEDTQAFWDGTKDGKLLIRHCTACGAYHYYPRTFCPECWSESVEWTEASGKATLYTHSTVYSNDLPPFNQQVPYVAAVVDLEEGPRMMTRIVGADGDDLSIGMPLEATFEAVDDEGDVVLVYFRPASA